MTTVFIPGTLQKRVGGNSELLVDVASINELLNHFATTYPEAHSTLIREGQLNRNVNLYVNGEDIKFLKFLDTPLKSGDEVSIVPAIAGG